MPYYVLVILCTEPRTIRSRYKLWPRTSMHGHDQSAAKQIPTLPSCTLPSAWYYVACFPTLCIQARLCVLVLSSDRRIALFVCAMIELVFHYYLGKSMPELAILAILRMLRREFKIRSRTSFSGIKNNPYKPLCYENGASRLPPGPYKLYTFSDFSKPPIHYILSLAIYPSFVISGMPETVYNL